MLFLHIILVKLGMLARYLNLKFDHSVYEVKSRIIVKRLC